MVQSPPRTNPFPGLRPFELDEEHLFFGREGQADELLTRLHRTRFLVVVGTSGSGKSSLVRAGLLPSLYSGLMQNASSGWRVAIMRPGSAPIANLAVALNDPDVFGVDPASDDSVIRTALTESTLRRGALGLVELTQQARMEPHENLLVVVDQFEELFRFKAQAHTTGRRLEAEDEAAAFVKLLLGAVNQREVPIFVVLTMRSDFLGDCAQFRDLPETLNESQYLIPRLTREQLRSAIEGPVAVGGATITPRLVNRLLNDTGDNPDQLPILQHALMRTWDHWEDQHQPQTPIDIEHYEAIGGMAKALSRHANQIYADLPDDQSRQIAKTLFKRLTDQGTADRAIRRPTLLGEICVVANASESDVIAVIDQFRAPRRSFLMPPPQVPLDASTVIDISHESLMRNWQRLKKWVDEEAQSAQIYKRLADTAELHEKGEAGYWRDPELTIGLTWQREQKPNDVWAKRYAFNFSQAISFLKASAEAKNIEVAEAEKTRRQKITQLRTFAGILFGLSSLSIAFAGFAMHQQKRAEEQAKIAEYKTGEALLQSRIAKVQSEIAREKTNEAEKQKKRAQDKTKEAEREKENALREKDSANKAKDEEGRQRKIAFQALARAEREEEEAIKQKREAEKEKDNAKEATRLALQEKSFIELISIESQIDSGLYFQAMLSSMAKAKEIQAASEPSEAVLMFALSNLREAVYQPNFKERNSLNNSSNSLILSPNGQIAVSGNSQAIDFWDFSSGKTRRFYGPTGVVESIAYSPSDEKEIVTASADGTVQLWDLGAIDESTLPIVDEISELSSNSDILNSGNMPAWEDAPVVTDTFFESYTFNGQAGQSIAVNLASDQFDAFLVVTDTEKNVIAYNDDSFESLNSSMTITLPKDGEYTVIATTLYPGEIGQYSLSSYLLDKPVISWRSPEKYSSEIVFSPDGTQLAVAGRNTIQIWNLLNKTLSQAMANQPEVVIKGHIDYINDLVFSPDGKLLASAGEDNAIRIWDLSLDYPVESPLLELRGEITQNSLLTNDGLYYSEYPVAVKADQTIIVTASSDSEDFPIVIEIKNSSGEVLATSKGIISSDISLPFKSWENDKYTIVVESYVEDPFGSYALSVSSLDKEKMFIKGHNQGISDIAFSANEKLVSADKDGNILEWNLLDLGSEADPVFEVVEDLDNSDVLLERNETVYADRAMYSCSHID